MCSPVLGTTNHLHSDATLAPVQAGAHILREGEELGTSAKFYMIESGTVECLRTFEVSRGEGVVFEIVLRILGSGRVE